MKTLYKGAVIVIIGYLVFAGALWLGASFVTYELDFWIKSQETRGWFLAIWFGFGWVIGAFASIAISMHSDKD